MLSGFNDELLENLWYKISFNFEDHADNLIVRRSDQKDISLKMWSNADLYLGPYGIRANM